MCLPGLVWQMIRLRPNAHIENITFKTSSVGNILRMVGTGAARWRLCDGSGIVNARAGATLYTATAGYGAAVKARLMRQTGSVTTMTSGAVI